MNAAAMAAMRGASPLRVAMAAGLLAAVVRLPLAGGLPVVSPDGVAAMQVAANIVQHGCLSLSDPASGACAPHWGGNHLPGYPGFIAAVWLVSGPCPMAVTLVQGLLVALAVGRLAQAMALFSGHAAIGLAAGLVLALSPVQAAWSRFVLPDALSVAAALWLFAELMLSLRDGRLRLLPVALPVLASCLLRLDGFLIAVAPAVIGFHLHRPVQALWRGLVVALVVALPLSALLVHNVARGLSLVPQTGMLYGDPKPLGYLAWGNTWISSIYQGGAMFYSASQRIYSQIVIDPRAYDSAAERQRVEALLERLHSFDGAPFPAEIDAAFAVIAAEKRRADPLLHYAVLPLQRMTVFWFHPFASFGWPLEFSAKLTASEREALAGGSPVLRAHVVLDHPALFLGKAAVLLYRVLLAALVIGLAAVLWRRMAPAERALVAALLAFAVLRTALLSYQTSIDNRYMVSAMAAAEVLLPLLVWRRWISATP